MLKQLRRKDPQAQAEKEEAKALKKYHKAYNRGVKKYQKEVAGGDTEMGKNRKVYKRMKKNHRASKRINKNKTATPAIIRFFRKDRIKEPFHKRMGRKIKRLFGKILKKDS